jgi:hypothetical protein
MSAAAHASEPWWSSRRYTRAAFALTILGLASGGMGLSLAAMIVAACGYLPPLVGALFQEAIDVAVILNALRALGPGVRD